MSESITVARPYAKAVFEHALAKKELARWSDILTLLAEVASNPLVEDFVSNPQSSSEQKIELLMAAAKRFALEEAEINHFLSLLVNNKRLLLLPEIKALYEIHRADQEKTLEVEVITFAELSSTQLQKLSDSLGKRLKRQVSLNTMIDPAIMGGAVIRAGDLVIDGSVRGKLSQLNSALAI